MTARHLRALVCAAAVAVTLVTNTGVAQAALGPAQLRAVTDKYLFRESLSSFMAIRASHPYAGQINWTSNGCTLAPERPLGHNFTPACNRHDFGLRNYEAQHRTSDSAKKAIDDNLRRDLYGICGSSTSCKIVADIYYTAVRKLGWW